MPLSGPTGINICSFLKRSTESVKIISWTVAMTISWNM